MRELIVYIAEETFPKKGHSGGTYHVCHRIEVPPNREVLDVFDNEMHTCDCECHGKLPTLLMRPFGEVEFEGIIPVEEVADLRSKLAVMGPRNSAVIPLIQALDSCLRLTHKPALFLHWM